jgi:hypothetical protein
MIIKLSDLRDLLTGALTAAGKDATIPTLMAVKVEQTGLSFGVWSTDRYRAVNGSVRLPDEGNGEGDTWGALLGRKDVEGLLKALPKPSRFGGETVSVTQVDGSVAFSTGLSSIVVVEQDGTFPNVSALMPNEDTPLTEGFHQVSVDPTFLAGFAKIPHARNTGLRMIFTDSCKPVQIILTHETITWQCVLMPQRITDQTVLRTVPKPGAQIAS